MKIHTLKGFVKEAVYVFNPRNVRTFLLPIIPSLSFYGPMECMYVCMYVCISNLFKMVQLEHYDAV